VGTLAMMGNALVQRPGATLLSAGIVAAGVPVYYAWRRRAQADHPGD